MFIWDNSKGDFMRKLLLSILLAAGLATSALGADITIYIKNNATATNIFDIIVLGRQNRGNGDWTTLWGGQKSSRNSREISFGYGELRKFVFKDLGMEEYQIRFTAKQGELNLVENYWTGSLSDGNIFVINCPGGACSLTKQPVLVPAGSI